MGPRRSQKLELTRDEAIQNYTEDKGRGENMGIPIGRPRRMSPCSMYKGIIENFERRQQKMKDL